MRDEHIISILEAKPLGRMEEGEMAAVREHCARCAECMRAYESARVAAALVKERAAAAALVEPTPFFQTRVLAALRERRAAEEVPALRRLWRAAGALVSTMAATVALLAGLTFIPPGLLSGPDVKEDLAASYPYSDDAVLLAQDDAADEEFDYAQVLSAIYESDENAEGSDGQNR